MRLPQSVIEGLQTRAAESGIPYQTLATTVLSRYIHGALLDKETFQAMAPTFTLPPGFVWPWESAEPHKDNNAEGKDRKVS